MPHEWNGAYLDGRVASRQPATVRLAADGLHITTAQGQALVWPYRAIRLTQGVYAGEQIRLEHGGPVAEVLFITNPGFLTDLRRYAPHLASRVHDPAHRRHRAILTALAAVAAIGLGAVAFRWGIPAFAALVTPWVPVSWEAGLGDAVVRHLAPEEERCKDPILHQRLDQLLAALVTPAHAPYRFELIVLDDDTLNAFAAPGGKIVVLRGLLQRTATPEELAGVLAHEAQHVIQRHSTRALLQHASTGLLVGALTGDVSGVAAFGLDAARTLGLLRFSRDHEAEADAAGMRMVLDAGIDPSGMVAFYEVLAREGPSLPGALQYLSTHPASADRVTRIRNLAGVGKGKASLGSAEEWTALRMRCHEDPEPDS